MTKTVKNQLLRNLHYLKSFGYEYHETITLFPNEIKNVKLPDNLELLKNSVQHCYLCEHSKTRKNVLFGYGNPNSNIMFISDEPSNSEDDLGVFYSGKSGELLKKMIENVLNINKEDVYLTTLVKCKSLNGLINSNIDTCNDYLLKQIELVKPKLIVALGEKSYSYLLKNNDNFMQIRGKELLYNTIPLIATFAPNFLLRNPSSKKDAYYDMLKIKNYMENLN
ncbi:MAG: uracil-DNA glycosylase [Aliarcobacter sp.]|nr:uracil-DNA glycosylase [Aliarcobacter sp.]